MQRQTESRVLEMSRGMWWLFFVQIFSISARKLRVLVEMLEIPLAINFLVSFVGFRENFSTREMTYNYNRKDIM